MKRLRWLMFPCVLLLTAVLVHGGGAQEKKKGKLQDTWTKDKDGKTIKLTFEKGKFKFAFEDKEITGTYKTDNKKEPKHIDMMIEKSSDGKFDGKTSMAIYEVDGDTLKWCAGKPGSNDRPQQFPEKEGEGGDMLYVIFKRAK